MTPEQADEAVKAARLALAGYALARRNLPDQARTAHKLGIPKADIARLAGISRSTVDRYVGADWAQRELDRVRPADGRPGRSSLPPEEARTRGGPGRAGP